MPLFTALSDKMRWHQARQGLLAENVANAETPGYQGRDLAQYNFGDHMGGGSSASLSVTATQPMHISVGGDNSAAFGAQRMNSFEVTPEGNAISLEDEMMKVTTNMSDYQAVTSVYQSSMKILRTALGRS
ncbi:flagellar basal body rod protein FlgB [Devosia algicola]|uniref:Flagellar basal body rod protein FlgB n=1 Tax=Devosia algicola TaxID=3026418 RepID=A0ABY7YRV3_9HYPH|nr:flagellar basal body rod protein FlgB [Devosia algicola]WDR03744.1 flagellar basal body rod protein FlgB [Devosia algicola]